MLKLQLSSPVHADAVKRVRLRNILVNRCNFFFNGLFILNLCVNDLYRFAIKFRVLSRALPIL